MYEFCMAVPVSAMRIGPVRGIGVSDCAQIDWEVLGRDSEAGVSSVT